MAGTPLKNLRIFEGICGRAAFKNVVLVTTKWDEVDEEDGAAAEKQLKSIYWKSMINLHASAGRFEETHESAFRLIAPFLSETNSRIALSIQKELVDFGFRLSDTHASQVLRLELEPLAKRQETLLHEVREELKRPNNATSLQSLMVDYEELKVAHSSVRQQLADLHVPLGRQFANTVARMLSVKR